MQENRQTAKSSSYKWTSGSNCTRCQKLCVSRLSHFKSDFSKWDFLVTKGASGEFPAAQHIPWFIAYQLKWDCGLSSSWVMHFSREGFCFNSAEQMVIHMLKLTEAFTLFSKIWYSVMWCNLCHVQLESMISNMSYQLMVQRGNPT